MLEFVERFATSPERREILRGLIAYREAIRSLGFGQGFQWANGSFCTDIERIGARPPNDIDIVTFAKRPSAFVNDNDFITFVNANISLFDPVQTKNTFKVDAYLTDLGMNPQLIVERTSYWTGLFGHQRVTALWKGMVRIEMACNDAQAIQHLDALDRAPVPVETNQFETRELEPVHAQEA